nr:hypothetical protein [Novosphingobium panipatense]
MTFFDTGRNEYLPIADIEAMYGSYGGIRGREYKSAAIQMKDGRRIEVDESVIEDVLRLTHTVIPAEPGYKLLSFYHDSIENENYFSEDTVLAWRAGQYRGLDPVVVDSEFTTLTAVHGILEPSGKVQTFECGYEDRSAWEAEMVRQAEAEVERQKNAQIDEQPS